MVQNPGFNFLGASQGVQNRIWGGPAGFLTDFKSLFPAGHAVILTLNHDFWGFKSLFSAGHTVILTLIYDFQGFLCFFAFFYNFYLF